MGINRDIGPCYQCSVVWIFLQELPLQLFLPSHLRGQLPEGRSWVRAVSLRKASGSVRKSTGENEGRTDTHEGADASEGLHCDMKENWPKLKLKRKEKDERAC